MKKFIQITAVFFLTISLQESFAINKNTVSMLLFDAQYQEEKVDVNWITATETNNNFFILERSSDGNSFSEVSKVKGSGNSTTVNEYNSTDYYPLSGVSYYRLKQVDSEGNHNYSDVIAIHIKNKSAFDFISVETTMNSTISLVFNTKSNEICNLQVNELSGTPVFNMDLKVNAGLNKKEIYCPFLNKGIYMLTISNDEQVLSRKISLIE